MKAIETNKQDSPVSAPAIRYDAIRYKKQRNVARYSSVVSDATKRDTRK